MIGISSTTTSIVKCRGCGFQNKVELKPGQKKELPPKDGLQKDDLQQAVVPVPWSRSEEPITASINQRVSNMTASLRNLMFFLAIKYPGADMVYEEQKPVAEALEERGFLEIQRVKDTNDIDALKCKITPQGANWLILSGFARSLSKENRKELEALAAREI
ncbi:MAG: hypothetical protein EOP06_06835 [Proteobacteria bacterium]|nr:MAG: hypothetical protein EOP06_06835 [Pseudomonadota bacterium]